MADPSNYVNFQDFMGLNDEAGQQMLSRSMGDGLKARNEAYAATEARFNAAKGGTEDYAASGERERKALASYGEFAQAMKSPADRQALMEKVYGKGRVSWMDSALAGGATGSAEAIGSIDKDYQRAQHNAESAGIRDEQRAAGYDKQKAGYEQQAKDYAATQAANRQRLEGIRAVNSDREDWAQWNAGENKSRQNPTYDRDYIGKGGIDPTTKKQMMFKKWHQLTGGRSQYGWGGAGTLRDAQGGGDY